MLANRTPIGGPCVQAIAPELGAVGDADAQQLVGIDVETVTAGDHDDVAVLGRDDTPRDPGSIRGTRNDR